MSNNVRRRMCLQALRPTNPLSTRKCLERPSYAAAYLDVARRAFSNSTSTSSQPSSIFRASRNKKVEPLYCLSLTPAEWSASFAEACRTKGISAHSIIKTPLDRRKAVVYSNYTCLRTFHSQTKFSAKNTSKGDQGSFKGMDGTRSQEEKLQNAHTTPNPAKPAQESKVSEAPKVESSSYLHMPKMPQMPHRPTREEVLAAATGFWSGLKLRFKWFSIRSSRPWNADDWSAFLSWFFLGHIVWIFVGTTTFFSIVIFTINTVVAQETLARWVGDYLTQSAGIKVVFESAIVPKWGDGVITFRNVFVSRRPGQGRSRVSKGSPLAAAAAAEKQAELGEAKEEEEEDTNYSQFDVTIDTVDVTLSLAKWWNGKGLLRDVEVKGVRGVIDRTSVHWVEGVDPRSYKHEHQPGDFEIDSFKMEDLLVTIHQPGGFRPFSVSIYSCDLPQLRKQWLFYDFLSANTMSGSFDGSLFTIHPRQTHGFAGSQANNDAEMNGSPDPWKKQTRLRIDGLKIDHLNRGVSGPFSWIQEGNVDIVADVMFPADIDDSIAKVMSDFYDRMEATVTSNRYLHVLDRHSAVADLDTPEKKAAFAAEKSHYSNDNRGRFLVLDLRVHLNDVRASIPLFTPDLSYVNNALVRPIVAYINSRKTFIPINCRVVKRISEFDGSWTIFDSGLMDDLSAETYEAFAKDVQDSQARMRRLRKVGIWSLSWAIHALLVGLAGSAAS